MKLVRSLSHVTLATLALGASACSDEVARPVAVIAVGDSFTASADAGTCGMVMASVSTAVGMAPQIHGGCSTTHGHRTPYWSWTVIDHPVGSVADIVNPDVISPTFVPDVAGQYRLRLVVNDGHQDSLPVEVTIDAAGFCGYGTPTASAVVHEPNATASACGGAAIVVPFPTNCGQNNNQSCFGSGDIQLDGSASSDPDNAGTCGMSQNLFYAWTLLSAPYDSNNGGNGNNFNTSRLLYADGETNVLRAGVNGTYLVRLIVTDSTGRQSTDEVCTIDVTGLN